MNRHRTINSIGGFLVALALALPAAASASSLLSGYGGPGQGNQAILGSALLNGPRSGGGGGSGGASGSSTSGGNSVATATRTGSEGSSPSATNGKSTTGPASKPSAEGAAGSGQGAARATSTGASGAYPASERGGAAQQSATLGLSGEDLLLIILVLGMLAFMGVLTRRLTHTVAPKSTGS